MRIITEIIFSIIEQKSKLVIYSLIFIFTGAILFKFHSEEILKGYAL